jgi:hypothetical protein
MQQTSVIEANGAEGVRSLPNVETPTITEHAKLLITYEIGKPHV